MVRGVLTTNDHAVSTSKDETDLLRFAWSVRANTHLPDVDRQWKRLDLEAALKLASVRK